MSIFYTTYSVTNKSLKIFDLKKFILYPNHFKHYLIAFQHAPNPAQEIIKLRIIPAVESVQIFLKLSNNGLKS